MSWSPKIKFIPNPAITNEIYQRLRDKYITSRETVPHLSELIYCLTRSYDDRFHRIEPTELELLYFSVGFGLEEVLLRTAESQMIEEKEIDGVFMTPDYISLFDGGADLKTTRMWPDKADGYKPSHGWPDSWMRQFMGYSYLIPQVQTRDANGEPETVLYSIAVVYIGKPALVGGTFTFLWSDVLENWEWIQMRRTFYMAHLEKQVRPPPFVFNQPWECKNCRYQLRCHQANKGELNNA